MHRLVYQVSLALAVGVGAASEEGQLVDEDPQSKAVREAPRRTSAQGMRSVPNGQRVQLRGRILSQQGGDRYVFSDGSGRVLVDIDSRLLNGRKLPAGTEVEIQGDADTRIESSPKVEVRSVMVLAARQKWH